MQTLIVAFAYCLLC